MTPDITGDYLPVGEYAGKTCYQHPPDGWFIWWHPIGGWEISSELGVGGDAYWARFDPDIEGPYDPIEEAVGIATVTEI